MSRDDDLDARLAELEQTLEDLRGALREDVRPTPRRRPPTPSEILRFTEEYTLPTVIALLEATVQSLELLRAVLRVAGPGADRVERAGRVGDSAGLRGASADRLRDALGDLREALSAADLPENAAAQSILDDARRLTADIDQRLADAETNADREGRRRRDERAKATGIDIEVSDPDDGGDADPDDDGVDVDAELESIRREVRGEDAPDASDGGEGEGEERDDDAGGDAGDDAEEGE